MQFCIFHQKLTKETTARNPSVGADGGQSSKIYTSSIAETDAEFNENFSDSPDFFQKLQRAQIAYRVSTSTDLWGCRVHGGTVLYLALEDDKKRLQERMARMFGVEGCDNLYFATHAGQVGQNLDKQLQNLLREHPDTVLVITDTLQKVREMTAEYSYASDYDVITSLKQLADSYNICLLLVHHTRKQPAGDNFEMISGTNGLWGGSDGALLTSGHHPRLPR